MVLAEGIDACKAVLGHADVRMSTHYSTTADTVLARRIAAKHG
jgi:hypothetical protein